jgi:hypothetical protein
MTPYPFQIIHTLEARSNALLEVTAKHFRLNDPQIFQMIQGLLQPTVAILASKGIVYEELRNVLVPSRKKHDRALVFNYNSTTILVRRGAYVCLRPRCSNRPSVG